MTASRNPAERLGQLEEELDDAAPGSLVDQLRRFLGETVDARQVDLYLASHDWAALRLVGNETVGEAMVAAGAEEPLAVSWRRQEPAVVTSGSSSQVHLPVSHRGERLGVLRLELPGSPDSELIAGLDQIACVVATRVLADSRYTDIFERARRLEPYSLPAELQSVLLPPRTCHTRHFTVAGQVIPTSRVGGDHFDYQVHPTGITVTASDAMGHGLEAALVTALGIGALRHARRLRAPLVDQIDAASTALHDHFQGERFMTLLTLHADLDPRATIAVVAGHPGLIRIRDGRITTLNLDPHLPLGLFPGTRYQAMPLDLLPGDRLVAVSDGTLEAMTGEGEQFAELALSRTLNETVGLGTEETVAALKEALHRHQPSELRDDATIVCLDWHPHSGTAT